MKVGNLLFAQIWEKEDDDHLVDKNSDNSTLIRHNPNSGRLEDQLLNIRVMIMDEDFYRGLRNKLYSSFQSGASVILYDMGIGYGEIIGHDIKKMGGSRLEIVNGFVERGKSHGYGIFKTPLLKMILSGLQGEPVVRLEDSFFATSAGDTGKSECYLVAGMIAGAAQVLLQKKFVCVEEKCLSKGDSFCEFKLRKPTEE